ncbi:MAG: SPOR domain-containing protein [Pseudomonadales bacterium]
MASRKDFGQPKPKSRRAASKKQPAPAKKPAPQKAQPAPAPVAHKRRVWPLLIGSFAAVGVLAFALVQLSNVNPRDIREAAINELIAEKTGNSAKPAATAPNSPTAAHTSQPKPPVPSAQPAPKPSAPTTRQASSNAKDTPPVVDKSSKAEQKEPYQFYKILAEDSVDTETVEAYKSTPKTAKLEKKTLLQTGSFRNQHDADRMKAKLTLNNLPNVSVGKVSTANGTWYRVRTGPFTTFNQLQAAQKKLAKMSIIPIQVNAR